MNEPLGIALELMQKRRALAARLSPLARRLAFPEYFDRGVAKRVVVQPFIRTSGSEWSSEKRVTKEDKAIAAQPKAVMVVDTCARIWGVPSGQLYDQGRKAIYVRPRQAAMALMVDLLQLSQPVTGLILNRDHTTVEYGLRSHEVHYATRADYRQRYDAAEKELREVFKGNSATSDTALAGGEVDGRTERPSHPSSASMQKRAA